MRQLTIDLGADPQPGLAEFVPGTQNLELLHAIQRRCQPEVQPPQPHNIHLWGLPGVGKTHLLRAACKALSEQGLSVSYLEPTQGPPDSGQLNDMAGHSLACMDAIERIAGNRDWEVALYDLHERMRDHGRPLLSASRTTPGTLPLQLADLASRLGWGLVYRVHPLQTDAERLQALLLRARARSFTLHEDVARFLLQRLPRDMPTLCTLLDHLDHASLSTGRHVTVRFVRDYLLAAQSKHTASLTCPGILP